MAWTSPMTAVANQVFRAADFNISVRDNLLETEAAKASAGLYFTSAGGNSINTRLAVGDTVTATGTTMSTTYADLAGSPGPTVSVTTGTKALVMWGCRIGNPGNFVASSRMGIEISGASSIAADDDHAVGSVNQSSAGSRLYLGQSCLYTGLVPGTNIFTAKYRTSAGGGTGQASIEQRTLTVIPF